ncbi:MAG: hypothetical protein VX077_01645, partial [Pseudomonadota bacterium]|nr:hypothetical protein [Pseudomonadota bacterium]
LLIADRVLRVGGPKAAKRPRAERATYQLAVRKHCGLDLTPLRGLQISPAQSNGHAGLRPP